MDDRGVCQIHKSSKWDYRFSAGISLFAMLAIRRGAAALCMCRVYIWRSIGACSTFLIYLKTHHDEESFSSYIFIWLLLLLLLLQSRVVWCLFLYPMLYSCWLAGMAGCWDDYFVIIIQLMNADNPVGVNRPSIQRPCRLLLCCAVSYCSWCR